MLAVRQSGLEWYVFDAVTNRVVAICDLAEAAMDIASGRRRPAVSEQVEAHVITVASV